MIMAWHVSGASALQRSQTHGQTMLNIVGRPFWHQHSYGIVARSSTMVLLLLVAVKLTSFLCLL